MNIRESFKSVKYTVKRFMMIVAGMGSYRI